MKSKILKESFEEKFEKGDINNCWNWLAYKSKKGYGRLNSKHKIYLAHRVSYEIYVANIPSDMFVLHKCDNPSCVNPNHLFLGTLLDNNIDRDKKGRQAVGENKGTSKLKEEDVIRIRRIGNRLTQRQIANKFRVSQASISNIQKNKIWRFVA